MPTDPSRCASGLSEATAEFSVVDDATRPCGRRVARAARTAGAGSIAVTADPTTRAVKLRCHAANLASLAACYREMASNAIRQAHDLDPDAFDDWSVDPDGGGTRGLPDDWMEIAERFEASERRRARRQAKRGAQCP